MGEHHALASGDYDGDGRTDRAIVELAYGQWFVIPSGGLAPSAFTVTAGPLTTTIPFFAIPWGQQFGPRSLMPGDYDGDGKTDQAMIDNSEGKWYLFLSKSGNPASIGIPWGWQWNGMGSHHRLARDMPRSGLLRTNDAADELEWTYRPAATYWNSIDVRFCQANKLDWEKNLIIWDHLYGSWTDPVMRLRLLDNLKCDSKPILLQHRNRLATYYLYFWKTKFLGWQVLVKYPKWQELIDQIGPVRFGGQLSIRWNKD
jgi:hypothetical protein